MAYKLDYIYYYVAIFNSGWNSADHSIIILCAYFCSWMTSWSTIEQRWLTRFRCYRVVAEVYIPRMLSSYISLSNLGQVFVSIHDCELAICV